MKLLPFWVKLELRVFAGSSLKNGNLAKKNLSHEVLSANNSTVAVVLLCLFVLVDLISEPAPSKQQLGTIHSHAKERVIAVRALLIVELWENSLESEWGKRNAAESETFSGWQHPSAADAVLKGMLGVKWHFAGWVIKCELFDEIIEKQKISRTKNTYHFFCHFK